MFLFVGKFFEGIQQKCQHEQLPIEFGVWNDNEPTFWAFVEHNWHFQNTFHFPAFVLFQRTHQTDSTSLTSFQPFVYEAQAKQELMMLWIRTLIEVSSTPSMKQEL